MRWLRRLVLVAPLAVAALTAHGQPEARPDPDAERLRAVARRLRVPEGFAVTAFAAVPGARSMALGAKGTLFLGTRRGSVHAVRDADGDGWAERRWEVASGLDEPNGVAFRDGALYVAEVSRILRFDGIEDRLDAPPSPQVVTDRLPRDRHHGWKYVAFGPDGLLYVPVGAPCNACERPAPYASILRMRPDGSGLETFAEGVRNTVGFDWHPTSKVLWFTDNGRDWMGDDLPPDELNRAPRPGLHFGFPWVHGRGLRDPQLGGRAPQRAFEPPAQELGAHVAALGMRFYVGTAFPERWRGQVFVAEHGSWNRSTKVGYRVAVVRLEEDRAVAYEPFAQGWLEGDRVHGRPVDVAVDPAGALLVSDDHAGAVWRIAWKGPAAAR